MTELHKSLGRTATEAWIYIDDGRYSRFTPFIDNCSRETSRDLNSIRSNDGGMKIRVSVARTCERENPLRKRSTRAS